MQGLRFKFGDRRTDWRCCFCCHVRTGTIFIGVWYLMVHALLLSVMAVILSQPRLLEQELDPILPTPLSEVDQVSPEMYADELDWTINNDGSNIRSLPLLPHGYWELWERHNATQQDVNIGVVVTMCSFTMTLMLVYGAIKGKPSYLMPFFCLKVFDFCVSGISAIGYFCYPPEMGEFWAKKLNNISFRDQFGDVSPSSLVMVTVIAFILVMMMKLYFISIIWRCYKYLSFRQISAQRTVHFIDPVVQNLLPDLPDYETAVKKFPTPPPSYATAVRAQSPVGNQANPENKIFRSNTAAGNGPAQSQYPMQANKADII